MGGGLETTVCSASDIEGVLDAMCLDPAQMKIQGSPRVPCGALWMNGHAIHQH